MALAAQFEQTIQSYVLDRKNRLMEIIQDLVRIPSENRAPEGAEGACQEYAAKLLRENNWDPLVYHLNDVAGLRDHPLYWPGRNYQARPNVGARRKGSGGGRSLVLSGHIDTVPAGSLPWTRDPFGGRLEGNRLYGRGANDMKGGVGTNLFVAEAIEMLGIQLKGDLVVETVVDEEFGGVNGTLAGRLQGFNADAAIISEPSFLRICAGQRGGRTVHITLQTRAEGGVLTDGRFPGGVLNQVRYFLVKLQDFIDLRKQNAQVHGLYVHHEDPVPVSITKIHTGPWGTGEPTAVPETCQIEMYWQAMPGESLEKIDNEFFGWFEEMIRSAPELFPIAPKVEFPIRWLPGSAISKSEPIVEELAECAESVLGQRPPIVGIEGPCDLYVFHQAFGIPAVLWGARGGNTHAADEYLEVDSVVQAAQALLLLVCRWCGVANNA